MPQGVKVVLEAQDRLTLLVFLACTYRNTQSIWRGVQNQFQMLVWLSTFPLPLGNTRPRSPLGAVGLPVLEGMDDRQGEGNVSFARL